MTKTIKIVVLGGGAWGTALASLWASAGHDVSLWARDENVCQGINEKRRNDRYLPDIDLAENLGASSDIGIVSEANLIAWATPAQTFAELSRTTATLLQQDAGNLLCAKGIDRESGQFLAGIAEKNLPADFCAVLSGPSFAHDVAKGLPTAVTLAAAMQDHATHLASLLSTPTFRIYASDDIAGVEAGGALKNVAALAVGMARGLDLGASAEAALIARAFAELARLITAVGGRAETFAGLSGLGDLVLTCSSPQSRNFSYGVALAREDDLTGRPLAEGVYSAEMASKIAREKAIETPIIDAVAAILDGQLTPRDALGKLLSRPLKAETG